MRNRKKQITFGDDTDIDKLRITFADDTGFDKLNFITSFYSNVKAIELCIYDDLNLNELLSILTRNLLQILRLKLHGNFNDEHLLLISKAIFGLKHLELSYKEGVTITDEGLTLMLSNLTNLKTVEFPNFNFPWIGESTVKALASLQFLNNVTFYNLLIPASDFRLLMDAKGKNLEQFSIIYIDVKSLSVEASFFLLEIFNKCSKLKKLNFSFLHSTIENIKLVNIPSLTDVCLDVGRCILNASSEIFASVRRLEVFLDEATDSELARIISCFPTVKCLYFHIASNISYQTFRAISSLKKLRKLELMSLRDEYSLNVVTEIVTLARSCVNFYVGEIKSEAEFTTLLAVFERIANERRNEIIKLRLNGGSTVLRPLPSNLKLIFY
ncbi:hypothetical protein B4U79_16574 [Dinothrombium tinctorium]|uniref:Uncharacterized protein n=1 Tax=Dinothrombium tinctorium TaxID=1965070 RepID=A0A3S3RPK9_9ACAR|nr:hypothetical protein B4U79_16574 [Dinothrombium tinctorium]